MKKLIAAATTIAAVITPIQVNANVNIPFNGSVASSCIITVGSSGTLAANTDFTVLSSEETGGAAGTATILATGGGFSIRADAPASFSSGPTSANDNVTFAANYAVTGANTIAKTDGGTATVLNRGASNVSINMSGTKNGAGESFEAGTYAATVVLRCE